MIVHLVVATGNRTGQSIPVSGEKFIIGRAEDCHLRPRSELISRYHCAILSGNEVVMRDLGSKNGVRLNGEKISGEHVLKNGDKMVIGPLEFYVYIAADPGAFAKNDISDDTDWLHKEGDDVEVTETLLLNSSALLEQLKALNEKTMSEMEKPEQNMDDILRKFL